MNGKREYGDYQTPCDFAAKVCRFLKEERHLRPSIILEPTCGQGHFLRESLIFDASEIYGVEINPEYCQICSESINDERVKVINADIFHFNLSPFLSRQNVLILGNPPWVNNGDLSVLGSKNLPVKSNFKDFKGIDAITGASNFDICEYIILRLLKESSEGTALAMLCKTSVARNIFKELKRERIGFSLCEIYEFDAAQIFGISASACLLFIRRSETEESPNLCQVYSFDRPNFPKSAFGYKNGQFYSEITAEADIFEGKSRFEWRQGVKHDCSTIMELTVQDGELFNGCQEKVSVEKELVFPLVKGSMFKKPVISGFSKYVLMTQKKAREETDHLQIDAPQTWAYLDKNRSYFDRRKSSIYRGAPAFSMFGVGDYSYSKYKVGIGGFSKTPLFSVLFSSDEKPVMTDDTCYFIGFDDFETAYAAMLYLNSERVQTFLKGIAFLDSKRPFTKKVLERIDFEKIAAAIPYEELLQTEKNLGLPRRLTKNMSGKFARLLVPAEQFLF